MKHPDDSEACFEEKTLEQDIELTTSAMVSRSPLEEEFDNVTKCLVNKNEGEELACIEELDGPKDKSDGYVMFEALENSRPMEKPKVELKTLPVHLKYVFLEDNETKPVIISSSLQKKEEDQLV